MKGYIRELSWFDSKKYSIIVFHGVGSSRLVSHGTSYALNVGHGHLELFEKIGFE